MLGFLLACSSEGALHGAAPPPPEHVPDVPDASAPADSAAAPPDNDFVFDGTILELTLDLDAGAVAGLATSWSQDLPDVHATLGYGADTWEVGVHLRGPRGAFEGFADKPGFKIDFDQWVDGGRFYGLEHLTLDSLVEDPSMLAARATWHLLEAAGLPAPRAGYAHLTVNGADYGLYGIVETADRQYVARAFPETSGVLFAAGADLVSGNEDAFTATTGADAAGALPALFAALEGATDSSLLPVLDGSFGTNALLDAWAVDLATGNPDGFLQHPEGYDLYFDGARWFVLSWRANRAFFDRPGVHAAGVERLYTACRASSSCAAQLDARLAALVGTWESSDLAGWAAAESARISAACHADPKNPWGPAGCDQGQGALLDYLRTRPAAVRAGLGM